MCPWYGWSESGDYLPAQETFLCEQCRKTFLVDDAVEILKSKRGLQYSRPPKDMFQSALDGCHLCRELLCMPYDYQWTENGRKISARSERLWPLDLWITGAQKYETPPARFPLLSLSRESLLQFQFTGDVQSQHYITVTRRKRIHRRLELILEISAEHGLSSLLVPRFQLLTEHLDDPVACLVPNRLVNSDLTCETTYKMARAWLATCHTQHDACRTSTQPTRIRPTFVLDVSPPVSPAEPDRIKLHRLTDHETVYATLSYCWGGPQINVTTKSRLTPYMKSIQMLWLPQTIQDAITVTRKLGLQYLWVDSLCIIQDAEEDKMVEIGKMEHIYTNAYVMISAASSPNCHQGFLDVSSVRRCSIEIPFAVGGGESGIVALTPMRRADDKSYYRSSEPEPIDTRAWTFQESFVSCRRLIYSKHQLFWACADVWGHDGGRMSREDYFGGLELTRQVLPSPTYEDWLNVIWVYSKKKLSDPLDKLSALSSIAAYFARHLQNRYLAGLWDGGQQSNRMLHGLCWYGNDYSKDSAHKLVRSLVWRAPSWSFLSMDGQIGFKDQKSLDFSPHRFRKAFRCTDINCEVVLFSPEVQFGRVLSGILKLNGRIIECKVGDDVATPMIRELQGAWKMGVVSSSSGRDIGLLRFDTLEWATADPSKSTVSTHHGIWNLKQTVWCLMLCIERHLVFKRSGGGGSVPVSDWQEEWRPAGLALVRLRDGTFHRIGMFDGSIDSFSDFRKQKPQLITII